MIRRRKSKTPKDSKTEPPTLSAKEPAEAEERQGQVEQVEEAENQAVASEEATDTVAPGGTDQARAAPKVVASREPVQECYVDGIAGVRLRAGIAKIDCYRVIGQEQGDGGEIRQLSQQLVLPALALNELIGVLQQVQSAAHRPTGQAPDSES